MLAVFRLVTLTFCAVMEISLAYPISFECLMDMLVIPMFLYTVSVVTIFTSCFESHRFSIRLQILFTLLLEVPCLYSHVTGVLVTYSVIWILSGSSMMVSDTGKPFSTG